MSGQPCPQCGSEIEMGYGLAGGGMGPYEFCSNPDCDYFKKFPDHEMDTPEETPDETAPLASATKPTRD